MLLLHIFAQINDHFEEVVTYIHESRIVLGVIYLGDGEECGRMMGGPGLINPP